MSSAERGTVDKCGDASWTSLSTYGISMGDGAPTNRMPGVRWADVRDDSADDRTPVSRRALEETSWLTDDEFEDRLIGKRPHALSSGTAPNVSESSYPKSLSYESELGLAECFQKQGSLLRESAAAGVGQGNATNQAREAVGRCAMVPVMFFLVQPSMAPLVLPITNVPSNVTPGTLLKRTNYDEFEDRPNAKRQRALSSGTVPNVSDKVYLESLPHEGAFSSAENLQRQGSLSRESNAPGVGQGNAANRARGAVGMAVMVPVLPITHVPSGSIMAAEPADVKLETLQKRKNEIEIIQGDFPEDIVAQTPMGRAGNLRVTKRPWEEAKAQYRHALKICQLKSQTHYDENVIEAVLKIVHRERMHAKDHVLDAMSFFAREESLVKALDSQGCVDGQAMMKIKKACRRDVNEKDHLKAARKALRN